MSLRLQVCQSPILHGKESEHMARDLNQPLKSQESP